MLVCFLADSTRSRCLELISVSDRVLGSSVMRLILNSEIRFCNDADIGLSGLEKITSDVGCSVIHQSVCLLVCPLNVTKTINTLTVSTDLSLLVHAKAVLSL